MGLRCWWVALIVVYFDLEWWLSFGFVVWGCWLVYFVVWWVWGLQVSLDLFDGFCRVCMLLIYFVCSLVLSLVVVTFYFNFWVYGIVL